jgi:solute carrier family 29 (equilibrative nucleoside transporter) protein 4
MVMSLLRLLLVVLVLLCIVPLGQPVLNHEAYSCILCCLLGVTNGYLGSIMMIEAGSHAEEGRREVTGNVMTMALCLGLTLGAGLAYGWQGLIDLTG